MEISLPAIIAAVANFAIGFLWYGPLFGKQWMKLLGLKASNTEEGKKEMPKLLAINFASVLVEAHILAYLLQKMGVTSSKEGAWLGFWLGLGIVGTTMLANYLYTKKPRNLFLIDWGYHLVGLIAMGAIIGYWS